VRKHWGRQKQTNSVESLTLRLVDRHRERKSHRELNPTHGEGQVVVSAGRQRYPGDDDVVLPFPRVRQQPRFEVVAPQFRNHQPCSVAQSDFRIEVPQQHDHGTDHQRQPVRRKSVGLQRVQKLGRVVGNLVLIVRHHRVYGGVGSRGTRDALQHRAIDLSTILVPGTENNFPSKVVDVSQRHLLRVNKINQISYVTYHIPGDFDGVHVSVDRGQLAVAELKQPGGKVRVVVGPHVLRQAETLEDVPQMVVPD